MHALLGFTPIFLWAAGSVSVTQSSSTMQGCQCLSTPGYSTAMWHAATAVRQATKIVMAAAYIVTAVLANVLFGGASAGLAVATDICGPLVKSAPDVL